MVRLSKCSVDKNELNAINGVLKNEFFGTGPVTKKFEDDLSKYFNNEKYSLVCTNTGTSAIQLALQACHFPPKSEILVPSLTYVASFQAITAAGHKPIACDINENDGLLSISDAKNRITSKTKAVMLVHYNGHVGNLDEYYTFAKENNLKVVEDAAHAFGSRYKKKLIGSIGEIACFSFDGIKNITCGEGGMVISSDRKLIESISDYRLLGVQGDSKKRAQKKRSWDFDVQEQGWRYHMSDIMAAIGIEQLKKFEVSFKKRRKELNKYYRHKLEKNKNIMLFDTDLDNVVPHIFPIRLESDRKKILMKKLKENEIQSGLHYKPNHLLSFFKTKYNLPVSETVYPQLITLPFHVDLKRKEIDLICKIISHVT